MKKWLASLKQHPLAIKLQSCDSVEAITGLFQDQALAFKGLQGSDEIMKSIKMIHGTIGMSHVSNLFTDIPICEGHTGLSCHPT
jgi:hypothetical protein